MNITLLVSLPSLTFTILLLLAIFVLFLHQPDSSVLPVFDQFVNDGVVRDSFSMQLCGSSEIDFSSEPTVAGTMVSSGRKNTRTQHLPFVRTSQPC